MKNIFATILLGLFALAAFADDNAPIPKKYVNSLELRIINKGFDNSERTFSRIPA